MFKVTEREAKYWNDTLHYLTNVDPTAKAIFYMAQYVDSLDDLLEQGQVIGGITFYYGATKLVLVSNESDVIIKIPFRNQSNRDYCAIEAEKYSEADRLMIGGYFAGVVYGGELDLDAIIPFTHIVNYSLYSDVSPSADVVQSVKANFTAKRMKEWKASCRELYKCEDEAILDCSLTYYYAERMDLGYEGSDEDNSEDYSRSICYSDIDNADQREDRTSSYFEFLDKSGKQSREYGFTTPQVGRMFFEQYGADVFLLLSDFVCANSINDLHAGNIMYDQNGRIRFTDYSGYGDCA